MPEEPLPDADERKQFADSTRDLPPWAQLNVEDIEMMDEEAQAAPVNHGTTAEGIAAMQRRITLLTAQLAKTEHQLKQPHPPALLATLQKDRANLTRHLAAARERLAAYEHQAKAAN